MTTLPLTFLSGNSLVPTTILPPWVAVIEYILPLTSGALNQQFQAVLTQLQTILNATPPTNLAPNETIIPINMVNNLQLAFNTFNYQNQGPLAWPPYSNAQEMVQNVYNQYSIWYYNSPPKPYFIFTP